MELPIKVAVEATGASASDQPVGRALGAELARPATRLGAYILDSMLAGIVASPFFVTIFATAEPDNEVDPLTFYLLLLPGIVLVLALKVYFDGGRAGATPGKMVMGIRIIDAESGGAIGYRRAVIRAIVQAIGLWAFYIGWLWVLWDRDRQAWHDKAAHDLVIAGQPRRWSVASVVWTWIAFSGLAGALSNVLSGGGTTNLVLNLSLALVGAAGFVIHRYRASRADRAA